MKLTVVIPDHNKDVVYVTFSTELQEEVTVTMTKKEFIDYVHGLDSTP